MANSTHDANQQNRSASERRPLVPTYIENMNAIARAHGLSVSPARIVREEFLTGYRHSTTKEIEHLVIDWRGTGAQLRSLGCILPSWSFPVATARGPGGRRLDTKWGIGGYVYVPINEDDVTFEIDHGDVPLRILESNGVETVSFDWCVEHHGTKAALAAAGIADEKRLGGKKQQKSNGSYPSDEARWWRLLQPDGLIVYGVETELAWRRRHKESSAAEGQSFEECQQDRGRRLARQAESADAWKNKLEYLLSGILMEVDLVSSFMGKEATDRFRLDPDSDAKLRGSLMRVRADIADAFASARVLDSQRAKLRLIVDNTPPQGGAHG